MKQKVIAAGVLAICPETERFILLKRRMDIPFPGYWGLPGGHFDEEDGFPKRTAIREFQEETGYNGPIKISTAPLYVDKSNQLDFYTYICILPWEFTPNLKGESICGDESLDYKWVKLGCKDAWIQQDARIIPSIITMLDLKEDSIKKVINKFKNKNYE